MLRGNNSIARNRGFTLVELLVATAITVTMLAAIISVFIVIMQTVTRGHSVQRGFELARGTLSVISRDLTAGHSARDVGDGHKFFGSPIGMSFIVKDQATAAGQPRNFARVTYVVYLPSVQNVEFTEHFAPDPNTGVMVSQGEFISRATYSLLRYVEPGVADLDSYPIDWVTLAQSAEFSVLNDALTEAMRSAGYNLGGDFASVFRQARLNPGAEFPLSRESLAMIEAKKRELWVRMLAGDPTLPDAWAILDQLERIRLFNQGFQAPPIGEAVNWRDYIVAENIAYEPPPGALELPIIDTYNPAAVSPTFFTFGAVMTYRNLSNPLAARKPVYISLPYWNAVYNAFGDFQNQFLVRPILYEQGLGDAQINALAYEIRLGSPLNPRMPELVGVRMGYQMESPFVGVPEFDKVFGQIIEIPSAFTRKPISATSS